MFSHQERKINRTDVYVFRIDTTRAKSLTSIIEEDYMIRKATSNHQISKQSFLVIG
jgi:hypothetical protein